MGETDDGEKVELSPYIERDPVYLLLRDEALMESLRVVATEFAGDSFTVDQLKAAADIPLAAAMSHADLLDSVNVLLGVEGAYVVNEHHPLTEVIRQPNIDLLVGDDTMAGVAATYVGKFAVPCLMTENIVELTGFEEDAVKEATERLRALDVIRGTMIVEGHSTRRNTVEDAEETLERVDALVEVLDEEGRDTVAVEEIEDIIGDIQNPDHDEDRVLGMTEETFLQSVRKAAAHGISAVEANDSIYTYEGGESGYTLNKESLIAELLHDCSNKLLRHVEAVHAFAGLDVEEENEN